MWKDAKRLWGAAWCGTVWTHLEHHVRQNFGGIVLVVRKCRSIEIQGFCGVSPAFGAAGHPRPWRLFGGSDGVLILRR